MLRGGNIIALLNWIKLNGAWNSTHTFYTCETCNRSFQGSPSAKAKFCSKVCYNKWMATRSGKNTPNWKGGKSHNNKCLDCQTKISFISTRCRKCAAVVMPHVHIKDRPWLRTKESIRKALRRHPISSLEIKFKSIIEKYNLPYKFVGNGNFFIEKKNPDFINTNGNKIAIEVYARIHKEKMRNMTIVKWKKEREKLFSKYGWKTLFFDETQINEQNVLNTLKGGASHP